MPNLLLNLAIHLPLPGAGAASELHSATHLDGALKVVQQRGKELVGSWLGRKLLVQSMERWKGEMTSSQIIELWQRVFDSSHRPQNVWSVWQSLSHSGLVLPTHSSLNVWQFQKLSSSSPSQLREIAHRILVMVRLSLETTIYYFGFSPKYMFSARSLWDMEHRFLSLERLTGVVSSIAIGLYQAKWIVPIILSSLGISQVLWAQAILTAGVALSTLFLISAAFWAVRRLLKVPPAELWNARNMNYEAKMGLYQPLSGCEEPLKKLSQTLCAGGSPLVWIRGHAGTGKTCLVQELARRLTLGKLPKEIGTPQIFFINSAHLSPGGYMSSVEKLEIIRSELEGFEKQVILAFDECHLLDKSVIEHLKSWKESGIRLILISNSNDQTLSKLWGKDTLRSLESHTKNMQIQMDEISPDLLSGMLQTALDANPHTQLTKEAQETFVQQYQDKPGAPRLMSLALNRWATKAKLLQEKTPELLEVANNIEALQIQLTKSVQSCDWEKSAQITQSMEAQQQQKSQMEGRSKSRQLKLASLDSRYQNFDSLRQWAVEMAQDSNLKAHSWKVSLLSTLKPVLQSIRSENQKMQQQQLGSYPFVWNPTQLKELL